MWGMPGETSRIARGGSVPISDTENKLVIEYAFPIELSSGFSEFFVCLAKKMCKISVPFITEKMGINNFYITMVFV